MRRRRVPLGTLVLATMTATAFVTVYRPPQQPLLRPPFDSSAVRPFARPAIAALGVSGGVRMRFVLPERPVEFPLELADDSSHMAYQWVRVVDTVPVGIVRALTGESLSAPDLPGFYRLALLREGERRIVDGLTVTVLVPFGEKEGATLHGVRLGTWAGERRGGRGTELPMGFFPVPEGALSLQVSTHLRVRDLLIPPDDPDGGAPGFATLDDRLLDKLELVMAELQRVVAGDGAGSGATPTLLVNSGFRAPAYNRTVSGAASDSRHQYGDAADVRIDLNGDGRFTLDEARKVARAVETVERAHPQLVGGLGLYTSRRYRSPYIHIDARGTRVRWTG